MSTLFDALSSPNTQKPSQKGILYCDGGSRGNPGRSAGGAVLYDENMHELDRKGSYYGVQTNNFAEYSGMVDGLELGIKHDITDLKVFLDSNLIVEQMSGNWKVKNPNIKPLFERAKNLCESFEHIDFTHVLRHKNKIADSIVNQVLDRHESLKNGFDI